MSSIAERIEKQIASLSNKIARLSGNHLTNTYKRQREQRQREDKKEKLAEQMHVLQFLGEECYCRELSPFEAALIVGTFYEAMKSLMNLRQYQRSGTAYTSIPLTYERCCGTEDTRFKKAGITNTEQLMAAIDAFEALLDKAIIKPDPNAKRIRELTFEARNNQGGDIQFTPEPIVRQLINFAGINKTSKVLEPEAGIGYIADEVKKITPDVDCMENFYPFNELLQLKGHNVIGRNFYDCEPRPEYDAVIMNPPFSDECGHIRYAYEFLKPGGVLVAVCCVRIQKSDKRKYMEFRDWLDQQEHYYDKVSGKFEMTGTNTVILTINKQEAA